MTKLFKNGIGITLALLLLGACGTSQQETEQINKRIQGEEQKEKIMKEEKEQANKEINNDDQNSSKQADETMNNHDSETKIRLFERNLSYQINGQTIEDTAFLKESDNQDFSLYVLPDYQLTAEEPNKDIIYLTKDDHHYMRIELLSKEQSIDEAVATMKEQLSSVSSNVSEYASKQNIDWLQAAHAYEAKSDEDFAIGILIEKEKFLLKLTIFTKNANDYSDAFLKMGETIESKTF